jgi:hypothetical protein
MDRMGSRWGEKGRPIRYSNFCREVWPRHFKVARVENVGIHALRHSAAMFMMPDRRGSVRGCRAVSVDGVLEHMLTAETSSSRADGGSGSGLKRTGTGTRRGSQGERGSKGRVDEDTMDRRPVRRQEA